MLSQDDEEVGLYFVIPDTCKSKEDCEPVMLHVFTECGQQGLDPQWLTETKCLTLQPDKRNVFVFQSFEGKAFDHLKQFKCVLVGPQCLHTVFTENTQLPHLPKPFFTMAMSGLLVAASGFGPKGKEIIKKKIELMAGQYLPQLRAGCTHLVVSSVQSEKYFKAIDASIPVMTERWIEAVYNASVRGHIKATDPKFDTFKCPPFQGLLVSSSKLSASHKKKVAELIQANGGNHVGSLTAHVNLLVISRADGEKYRYARTWNIPCVPPKYVYDCIELGRALHVDEYVLKDVQTSSPEKAQRPDPNFSTISGIGLSETHVDETLMSSTMSEASSASYFKTPKQPRNGAPNESNVFVKPQAPPVVPSSPKRPTPSDACVRRNVTPKKNTPSPAQFKNLLDELDLHKTKQAGQFLDGCKVFLYGFNSEHEEKLRRILKGSGASRFTELTESVTHVLLGDVCDKNFSKQLKELSYRPHIVTLQWLLQSVTLRKPSNEELYSYTEAGANNAAPETPSPLSKKGLALLQRGDGSPVAERERAVDSSKLSSTKSSRFMKELREPDKNEVSDLTAFYRNESASEPPEPIPPAHPAYRSEVTGTNSDDSKDLSTVCSQSDQPVFSGLKFVLVGLDEEAVDEISRAILQHSGQMVPRTFKGVPDYAVVPITGGTVSAAGEVVTPYWVDDCIFNAAVIPVEYFHRPMSVHSGKYPLKGCVIGLSGYTRKERLFITDMTRILGGIAQEVFARKDNPEKKAKASTHLVCNAAEGSKFTAAKKWKLPAVTHLWLLDCCKTGRLSPVRPFLIDPDQDVVEPVPREELAQDTEDTTNAASTRKSDSENANVSCATTGTNDAAETSRRSGNKTEEKPQENEPVEEIKTPLRPRALQRIAGEAAALSPFHVSTPDTPYHLSENPSPGERKRLKKWLDRIPDYPLDPEPPKKRLSTESRPTSTVAVGGNQEVGAGDEAQSTGERSEPLGKKCNPLSEIRRQCWAKFGVPTPETPDTDKPGNKRTSDATEESLPQSAKRARTEEGGGKSLGDETPPAQERPNNVQRTLFPDNVSRAEGQIEEANKLLQMPLPISGIGTANSSNGNSSTSPIKEKIAAPRVPKEVSQPYDINWEDPVTVAEAKNDPHYEDRRNTVTSASSSKRKSVEEEDDSPSKKSSAESKPEDSEVEEPALAAPKTRVFMLSSVNDRERYANMVEALGGKVLAGIHFDKAMSHLIMDKPARSEKLLACIASGKWVLHAAYIEDSFKAGKFLDEVDYEWGAPRTAKLSLLRPGSVESELAKAACRWRKKLSGTGLGAFQGFRAVVGAGANRIDSFKRLIEAGGGVVLEASELEKATHYFVDSKSAQNLDNSCNVPVFPLIHLSEFLMEGPKDV